MPTAITTAVTVRYFFKIAFNRSRKDSPSLWHSLIKNCVSLLDILLKLFIGAFSNNRFIIFVIHNFLLLCAILVNFFDLFIFFA